MIDDLLTGSVGVPNPERFVRVPTDEAEIEPAVARGSTAVEPEKAKPIEGRAEALDVDRLRGHRRRRAERNDES